MKQRKPSFYFGTLCIGTIIYVIGIANMHYRCVVFASQTANLMACYALVTIPFLLLAIVSSIEHIRVKATIIVILLPAMLFSLFAAILISLWVFFGASDNQRVEMRRYKLPSSQLILYHYNTGVLGNDWLALQQEKELLPGILLVKKLYDIKAAEDMTIIIRSDNIIDIQAPPYSYMKRSCREDITIKVKANVYY